MFIPSTYVLINIIVIFICTTNSEEVEPANVPTTNSTNTTVSNGKEPNNATKIFEEHINNVANKTQKFANCFLGIGTTEVKLTNDTELIKLLQSDQKITNRETPALCVAVLFYSKYCPFSTMAGPHFNALPRAFPDIKFVAINAMMYHLFNTQNGIVGVPSLLLFHNGRSLGKFNGSEYTLDKFSQFIYKHTGIAAIESVAVTSADFSGPVANVPVKEYDLFLILSWVFIILCGGYYFTKSKWWKWIIESVQSNWRDSEVHSQHEHMD